MNKNTIAALTYLVFFLPRLTGQKEDGFLNYHSKQALGLLIVALALQGAMTIILLWIFGIRFPLLWGIRLFLLYEVIVGMKNAFAGRTSPLPYIGEYSAREF